VHRGEHEVPGLRGLDGGHGRISIADLADEDHVGVLPQHLLQGRGVGLGVRTHLALPDHGQVI
jgi:hypothetical protein